MVQEMRAIFSQKVHELIILYDDLMVVKSTLM